jgi:undecaprenyl-diphosphatase
VSDLDSRILLSIHEHVANPTLDDVVRVVTHAAGTFYIYLVVAVVAIGCLLARRTPETIIVVFGVLSAKVSNFILKHLIGRERPHLWHTLTPESTPSMPSGHAAGAAALACAAILLTWNTRWRWPVVVAAVTYALIIGFTRMYLGVHYPSDVLAGWMFGALWMALVWRLTGRMRSTRPSEPRAPRV